MVKKKAIVVLHYGGRYETRKQAAAARRNLKKARAAKAVYRKAAHHIGMGMLKRHYGGFAPATIPLLIGAAKTAHETLQKFRPVSGLKAVGQSLGIKLPDNKFGKAVEKIGNFLIDKAGYGRRRRRAPRRRSRHVRAIMI